VRDASRLPKTDATAVAGDPSANSPAECKAVVAAILAAGCCRLTVARAKALALTPPIEPSCGNAVNRCERHGADALLPREETA